MGFQQTSPSSANGQRVSSPPSAGSNKGRRPTTLSVGATSAPTKNSPTGRAPSSPASGKSSPTRSQAPKRTASIGKGSSPPTRTTTCPQGPTLATEARSKVRPCGCSRRHGGGGHHHGSHTPETTKERPHRRPRSESPTKPRVTSITPELDVTPNEPPVEQKPALNPEMALPVKTGNNRYVSTLVWVPRMHPEKFSTTLIVSTDEPTFTDAIYIKPRYQEAVHEEHLYRQGQTVESYSSHSIGDHMATSISFTPLAVS